MKNLRHIMIMALLVAGMVQAANATQFTLTKNDLTLGGTASLKSKYPITYELAGDLYEVTMTHLNGNALIITPGLGVGVFTTGSGSSTIDPYIDPKTGTVPPIGEAVQFGEDTGTLYLAKFSVVDSAGKNFTVTVSQVIDHLLGDHVVTLSSGLTVYLAGDREEGYTLASLNGSYAITSLTFSDDDPAVPEPATLSLIGIGLTGLGLLRRRRGA